MLQSHTLTQDETRTQEYYVVPLCALERTLDERVDLFVREEGTRGMKLLHSRSQALSREVLAQIATKEINKIHVSRSGLETIATRLLHVGVENWNDQDLAVDKRFNLVQLAYSPLVAKFFRKSHSEDFIDVSITLGRVLAQLLYPQEVSPRDLYEHTRYRYNASTHFINVAAYLILFAKLRGVTDEDELRRIGTGGMLHEIGKLFVEESSRDASSSLGRKNNAVPRHPQLAFEALLERPTIDFRQRLMTYQAHERFDGRGFPVALHGKEIDSWARMLAIVDVFDDSSNTRRSGGSTECSNVLLEIANSASLVFDPEMVLCWISHFQQA